MLKEEYNEIEPPDLFAVIEGDLLFIDAGTSPVDGQDSVRQDFGVPSDKDEIEPRKTSIGGDSVGDGVPIIEDSYKYHLEKESSKLRNMVYSDGDEIRVDIYVDQSIHHVRK